MLRNRLLGIQVLGSLGRKARQELQFRQQRLAASSTGVTELISFFLRGGGAGQKIWTDVCALGRTIRRRVRVGRVFFVILSTKHNIPLQ